MPTKMKSCCLLRATSLLVPSLLKVSDTTCVGIPVSCHATLSHMFMCIPSCLAHDLLYGFAATRDELNTESLAHTP